MNPVFRCSVFKWLLYQIPHILSWLYCALGPSTKLPTKQVFYTQWGFETRPLEIRKHWVNFFLPPIALVAPSASWKFLKGGAAEFSWSAKCGRFTPLAGTGWLGGAGCCCWTGLAPGARLTIWIPEGNFGRGLAGCGGFTAKGTLAPEMIKKCTVRILTGE